MLSTTDGAIVATSRGEATSKMRYATINFASGYVDGELETNAPFTVAEIAKAIMVEVDPHEAGQTAFTEIGLKEKPSLFAAGREVYRILDDLEIHDGTDA